MCAILKTTTSDVSEEFMKNQIVVLLKNIVSKFIFIYQSNLLAPETMAKLMPSNRILVYL